MTRLIWTSTAVEQFRLIREDKHRRRVYKALLGLRSFPRSGHVPPEVRRQPRVALPAELRELVFPELVRVFYRYDAQGDILYILAMSFRGQNVSSDWLRSLLN